MAQKFSSLDADKLNMIIVPECISRANGVSADSKMLHEDIEIKYFYEGSSTLLIGTETLTATAGDIIVINPYEFHATLDSAEAKGKYHLFMIPLDYFSGTGIDELELRTILLAKNRSFPTLFKNDARMCRILSRITKEYQEKGAAYRVAIRGLITEFFAILLRSGLVSKGNEAPTGDILHLYQLIEPALHHIRSAYTEPITVDGLCALCNISKYYFCRIFKTVTKKTAMEYLRDYRIQLAHSMLGNTNKSVSEIADGCGFEDTNYFCRCYKMRYGTSPGKSRSAKTK